jgi:putative flippase GtrA
LKTGLGRARSVARARRTLPAPFRFLGVGAIGLTTDICVFTLLIGYRAAPLLMRLFSLARATLVTWRLNRALTFDDPAAQQARRRCATPP